MRKARCKTCGDYAGKYVRLRDDGECWACCHGSPHQTRKARMYRNGGSHTPEEWEELKRRTGYQCVCCGATDRILCRDHIKPVAKGGRNNIRNLQPLCWQCNRYKGARHSMSYLGAQLVLCFCPQLTGHPKEARCPAMGIMT